MGFKNNMPTFERKFNNNQRTTLIKMGAFCKGNMDKYVPVDTGQLKSRNAFRIIDNTVQLINDEDYAGFVEKGTSRQQAQPFIEPAVFKHIKEITKIAKGGLGNGL